MENPLLGRYKLNVEVVSLHTDKLEYKEKDKLMVEKINSFYNLRTLEELSEKNTIIHKINPVIKLLTTILFLIVTISFSKYEISGILPLIVYPIIIMSLGEVPCRSLLKTTLLAMIFIIGIGIFNPLFDRKAMISIQGVTITAGWISFTSILVRGFLTIWAAQLLIATTGMINIAVALKKLKVPKIFIMQLLFTYRYISLFIEEVGRSTRAYFFRSHEGKGIKIEHWGSFLGGILLRTLDRAERVYRAMSARGFTGEYTIGKEVKIYNKDIIYFLLWSVYFIFVRYFNLSEILGSFI